MHCDDGKRFVVLADEKLTALLELEAAIRAIAYRLFSASPFNTSQATTGKTREALARVLDVVFHDAAFNHQWEI